MIPECEGHCFVVIEKRDIIKDYNHHYMMDVECLNCNKYFMFTVSKYNYDKYRIKDTIDIKFEIR